MVLVGGVFAHADFTTQDIEGGLYRGEETNSYWYHNLGAGPYTPVSADQLTGIIYNGETGENEETYIVCVQPSIIGMNYMAKGTLYSTTSKDASPLLAKVMFYGHASNMNSRRKARWYPDKFVDVAEQYTDSGTDMEAYLITHIAAAKVYGSNDWNWLPGGGGYIYDSFVAKVNAFIDDVSSRPAPPSNYVAKIYSRAGYQDYLVETGGPEKGKLELLKQSIGE